MGNGLASGLAGGLMAGGILTLLGAFISKSGVFKVAPSPPYGTIGVGSPRTSDALLSLGAGALAFEAGREIAEWNNPDRILRRLGEAEAVRRARALSDEQILRLVLRHLEAHPCPKPTWCEVVAQRRAMGWT